MKKATLKTNSKTVYTDMTKRIANITGLYQYQVRKVIVAAIQCIINDLALGKTVSLLSLGKFSLKKRPTRKVYNPRLKKLVEYKTAYLPKFKFGMRAYEFIKSEASKNHTTNN